MFQTARHLGIESHTQNKKWKERKKVPAPLPRFTIWSCCYNSNFIHKKKMAMMTTSLYNVWKLTVSKFICFLPSLKFCIPFHDWLFFVDNSSLESSLLLFFLFSLLLFFYVHKWPQIFGLLSFSEVMYTMYLSAFLPQLQYRQIFLFILYYIHRVKNWKCSPI